MPRMEGLTPPRRPGHLAGGLAILALVATSCSEGRPAASCFNKDTNCPDGTYCAENGKCVTDCAQPQDCPSGMTCTGRGKCVPARDQGGDLITDTYVPQVDRSPAGERSQADLLARDAKPWGDHPASPDMGVPDAKKPDSTPATTCAAVIGNPCTSGGSQCGTAGFCLLTSATGGVCVCSCTPDNPATPLVNEDTCPNLASNACGKIALSDGTTQSYCLRKCKPKIGATDCAPGVACDPASGSYTGLWQDAVCLFPGCAKDADCPVITGTVCDTAATPCPAGQTCMALASTTTTGRCVKPGKCDLVSGLCDVHSLGKATAKVGDPCKDDTECAGNMTCAFELDMAKLGAKKGGVACTGDGECCSGSCSGTCAPGLCTVLHRNGYCAIMGCQFASLTSFSCPAGSTCNSLYAGGRCQKTCSLGLASDCRGNAADYFGDYECRAWDNLAIAGVPIAASPVCDFGVSVSCALLGPTLDCTDLGDATNSTKMGCRTLDNKLTSNIHDPTGYCFDDTASGTQLRSPLPTP